MQAPNSTTSSTAALSGTNNLSINPVQVPSTNTEVSTRHVTHSTPHQFPSQHRDLSSSIASNLASARGIPPPPRYRRGKQSLPQVSLQVAEGRVLKPARRSNLGDPDIKASVVDEKSSSTVRNKPRSPAIGLQNLSPHPNPGIPPPVAAAGAEDPFSRFYSTFGNFISAISAPLAFAGLPLGTEQGDSSSEDPHIKNVSPSTSRIAPDPDLARFFSRAALRAVRDEHGNLGGAESFYVVPTSGGTISYAGVLTNARQGSNITEDEEAEFVDANEMPQPPSPGILRQQDPRPSSSGRTPLVKGGKTWEELAVENETLKAVTLDLGDRLRAFELGAQRSSRALHASVRGLSSPTGSVTGGSGLPPLPGIEGMKVLQEKLRESEEELKGLKKDNKRLLRENQKFMSVIERYRERWEMLKVGARERVKGDHIAEEDTLGS